MKIAEKQKDTILSGMSALAGAAAGTVGGAFIAQEANAAEVVSAEVPGKDETDDAHPAAEAQPAHNVEPEPEPTPTPEPKPEHKPETHPEHKPETPEPTKPEPEPTDTDIQVLSYETVTNEDGSQCDMAIVSVNGQGVAIIDVDQDGYADVMAADQNQNGQIDNNEVVDLQGQGIAMAPFKAEFENNQVALNDGPDYINDGDVDSFLS